MDWANTWFSNHDDFNDARYIMIQDEFKRKAAELCGLYQNEHHISGGGIDGAGLCLGTTDDYYFKIDDDRDPYCLARDWLTDINHFLAPGMLVDKICEKYDYGYGIENIPNIAFWFIKITSHDNFFGAAKSYEPLPASMGETLLEAMDAACREVLENE